MASAGHDSEQARQAQVVRLVVDTIPTQVWLDRTSLARSVPAGLPVHLGAICKYIGAFC